MAPTNGGLSEFQNILVEHEQEYRDARGTERTAVVQQIMEEMVAQSKGSLDGEVMSELNHVI